MRSGWKKRPLKLYGVGDFVKVRRLPEIEDEEADAGAATGKKQLVSLSIRRAGEDLAGAESGEELEFASFNVGDIVRGYVKYVDRLMLGIFALSLDLSLSLSRFCNMCIVHIFFLTQTICPK